MLITLLRGPAGQYFGLRGHPRGKHALTLHPEARAGGYQAQHRVRADGLGTGPAGRRREGGYPRGPDYRADPRPTGDWELDAALATLAARRPPRAKDWVGSPRRKILAAYLDRLAGAGVLQRDTGGIFPVTRWTIADPGRLATAQARLDAIARGTGPVDTGQAALAGLATAMGLGQLLYPG